jgi:hypothetical protein
MTEISARMRLVSLLGGFGKTESPRAMTALAKCAWWWWAFVLGVCGDDAVEAQAPRLRPVPFSAVDIRSEFWVTRQRVNREKTIPHLIEMCVREGRVRNLWRAAGKLDGDFEGTRHHDADLFKAIEAASYVLVLDFDPQLDRTLDELTAAISAALISPNGTWNYHAK